MAKGYNKLIGEQMEAKAREAYEELQKTLDNMKPQEQAGAEVVIGWFRHNYMAAGYKKLARKVVKEDIDA